MGNDSERWSCGFSEHYLKKTSEFYHPFIKSYCQNLLQSGHLAESIPTPSNLSADQEDELRFLGSSVYELLLACDMLLFSLERSMHLYVFHMLGTAKEFGDDNLSLARANSSLTSYLMTNFATAVEQAIRGNEIVARAIVRSISEASDLMLACQFDPQLRIEFIQARENFKPFWWKHLRKEKLSKLRKKIFREQFNYSNEQIDSDEEYYQSEYDHFSQMTHPSYDAGMVGLMMAGFPAKSIGEEPAKVWASKRSLQFAVAKTCVPIANALAHARDHEHILLDGAGLWPMSRDAIEAHVGGALAAGMIVGLLSGAQD